IPVALPASPDAKRSDFEGMRRRHKPPSRRIMNTSALLFHNVSPTLEGTPPSNTLSPDRFRQLMRRLAKAGYTGVSARDWWNAHHGGPALPQKPVVITFDDGYSNIADHALPVLRSLGFRATVFIVSSCIGR